MRKLALSLEDLSVESFSTHDAANGRGTAHGCAVVAVTAPIDTQTVEQTMGPPCTGQSCNRVCSYQICPADAVAGLVWSEVAVEAQETKPDNCLTCENTCPANCH